MVEIEGIGAPGVREPIVVLERSGGVLFFRSVEIAERYLEAIDVESGECRAACDSEGTRLRLDVVVGPQSWVFLPVQHKAVKISRSIQPDAEEIEQLRSDLLAFLKRAGLTDPAVGHLQIGDLVRLGAERLHTG